MKTTPKGNLWENVNKRENFKEITPENVTIYLENQPTLKKNNKSIDFFSFWTKIVANYIPAKDMCFTINEGRKTRIEYPKDSKKIITEISRKIEKQTKLDYFTIKQLVGVLFNIFNDSTEKKSEVATIIDAKQEAILKNMQKNEDLREDFSKNLTQLVEIDHEVWFSLSESEKNEKFTQVWNKFIKEHNDFTQERLQKLYIYFQKKMTNINI